LINTYLSFFFILKEFGIDITPFPKLNAWYKKMQSISGFDENLTGARYLKEYVVELIGRLPF
jgi:hypothetical protein